MRFTLLLCALTGSNLVYANYSNTKMTCLVNQERAKRGLGALGIDSRLTSAAQSHSNDQARRRQMTHTGSDGSDPGKRCTRAGFNWRSVAENVAYGYSDEVTCMKEWMNSPGHRANILGKYEMFGSAVAYAGNTPYYTQDFGTDSQGRRNVPSCNGGDYGDDNSDYGNNNKNSGNYGNNRNSGNYGNNRNSGNYGNNRNSGNYGNNMNSGNYGNNNGNNRNYGNNNGGNYGRKNSGGNKSYGKRFGGWPKHYNHYYTVTYSHY